ncbi:short-chain dehydrogenase/reductase SDR [Emticicia oligotrophica DSM 17448]|uniref:Short-chain dehydrogenase/reductase SDR n=1 Tax=Emticicia oligotrophica (strain DSM 17448 / CIP 109782 / MTCC 6937 / GPTSA100-15) TaxID=929562 RepID=A0ABM5MZ94_EMTOG|nr:MULTISPECIES: SDR family oxidoreductase [Emticicia]AFK02460.1 short-chain dehydrogenase/reductase SDR [Emticicia oligotrophica DSM 17448]
MNLDLSGKTAFVCGSTQGIGKAAAVELALLGANITLVARNEEKLKAVLDELPRKKGQKHRYLLIDFSKTNQIKSRIERHLTKYPEAHILVNNTGGPVGGPVIEASPDLFLQTFNEHVIAAQILTQALVPSMKKDGFGRIINITSVGMKQPIVGLGVSNTIRGAIGNWAKSMANELGKFGITTNNVLPGYTTTARLQKVNEMRASATQKSVSEVEQELIKEIPIGRFTAPQETAAVIAFLCSPAAASVNGVSIPVDGGKTSSL